uniref:Uncharacterized protein n=1 Tax=Oryza sativa subsp. japonica TaxID=39947 RepID=Q8H5X8_ORYSJ|nr:hypothetical protein [Oryza sativa Japonica Group]
METTKLNLEEEMKRATEGRLRVVNGRHISDFHSANPLDRTKYEPLFCIPDISCLAVSMALAKQCFVFNCYRRLLTLLEHVL